MQVDKSCETMDDHRIMWISAESGKQVWVCTQCGKEVIEWEDSQP